ncbi:MAG: amidohydrolase [Desulfobacteraceae bacterium]
MDLLVTNGTVLTLNEKMERIDDGAVLVDNKKIVRTGKKEEFAEIDAEKVIDARGGIIMPGLVNTHTHAAMTLFRGLADDLPLMEWLNHHIFPAESRLTEEKVYAGTMLACAEMILSGTTCFCDMYLFENEVARAASNSGMRVVAGEVLYDFPSPNYGDLDNGFAYAEEMMEKWRDDPLVTIAVEPHSPYICAPDLLKRAAALARKNDAPMVIHVAETRDEKNQIMEKYGKTPAAFLESLGVLGPDLVACHSIHLSEKDMALYKKYGVKVAHCPESNMKLASGVAPVPKMIEKGICVGLGTDGCASNNDLDLFLEMGTAARLHKVFSGNPEAVSAETAVRMATINGARTLGMEAATGSLEPGKEADIIVVDTSSPHLVPMYNPYSHLVYAASGSDVAATIIAGRVVMENKKIFTIDVKKVMDDVKIIARQIRINDTSH